MDMTDEEVVDVILAILLDDDAGEGVDKYG